MNVTKEILQYYKYKDDSKYNWYLQKYFTDNIEVGLFMPNHKDPVLSKPTDDAYIGTVDEHNTYNINSLGLRGEFYKNADILASGCSITFGIGIPEEGRWSNILSNLVNKNIMNLGNPGGSVETICQQIIQYCMNNTMPKQIFCLMPDLFRNMVVVDKDFYKSKIPNKNIGNKDTLELTFCNPRVMNYEDTAIYMEIIDKKYIEDATSPHQLILDAINYIYILESFCLLNNIKLYWTTWHLSSSMIIEELTKLKNFKLKNFSPFMLNINSQNLNEYISKQCNSFHNSEFKDNLCWSKGSDYSIVAYKKAPERSHPGIHFQYHVAEFFYELSIAK